MKEITDRKGATIYSRAAIRPNSYNEAERTFRVTFATETPVYRKRYDIDEPFNEVLSCTPEHIRLERANAGLPLFNNHNTGGVFTVFGKVSDIRIDNKELSGLVKLGARADEALISDIKNGILSGVSVGYNVYKYERTAPRKGEIATYKAIDWEPIEISLAPVQADINSKIRGIDEDNIQNIIDVPAPDGAHRGLSETGFLNELNKIINLKQDFMSNQNETVTRIYREAVEKKRDAMIDCLLHRARPTNFKAPASEYDSMTLLEMGKALLREGGVNLSGKTKLETVDMLMRGTRDMSVSDFPLLLENAANKMLRADYGFAPESWTKIAKQVNVTNFKDQRMFQVGSKNNMQEIPEGDELKYNKLVEAAQSIRVKTYGEGLKFTRQMLVNDDLGAFEAIPAKFVRDWDLQRGDLVWSMINDNVIMHDGKAIFSTEHKNLSVNPAALDEDSLTEALTMFRKQTDIDGETKIRVLPKYITVSPDQEIPARKLLTNIIAAKTGDVNVFSTMGLELIVEPRLTGMAWYLSASPLSIDGLCYAYLNGAENLRTNIENIFATDSINYAVRGEFGVAAVDYRGWYKNPGA